MILKAKIKSNYMQQIIEGKKRIEYRQIGNGDIFEMTDENGRTMSCYITDAESCTKKEENAIKQTHRDVEWSDKPILKLVLAPRTQYTQTLKIDAVR
jgi:hypothetical protein